MTQNNRRDFLRNSVSALGAAFISSTFIPRALAAGEKPQKIDLAVVGGGIAGLTFCYKMRESKYSMTLFEANPTRLGGRMETVENFKNSKQHIELGAEHANSDHKVILGLCEELGVKTFAVSPPGDSTDDIFFAHGKRLSKAELIEQSQLIVNYINEDLKNAKRDEHGALLWPSYNADAELKKQWLKYDNTSLYDYLKNAQKISKKNPNPKQVLQDWFIEMLIKTMTALNGPDAKIQSCIAFFQVFPLSKEPLDDKFSIWQVLDENTFFEGGSISLIRALEKQIQVSFAKQNKKIEKDHRLLSIEEVPGEDKQKDFLLTFKTGKGLKAVQAKEVVLATPLGVLKDIKGLLNLPLTDVKKKAIKEYGFGTNGKLILGFKERFWDNEKNTFPMKKRMGSDEVTGVFWEATKGQPQKYGALTTWFGGDFGKKIQKNLQEETLAFYEKVWPGSSKQFNGNMISKYWYFDKYTKGSYTCPTIGQFTTLYGCWTEPELEGRLNFIGEHTSPDYYGYMEGGCHTGMDLAAKKST